MSSRQVTLERPPTPPPSAGEHWVALGTFLLCTFYVWVLAWLLLWVLVPTLGLRWQPVVVTSGSMTPLIRPGDVVLVDDEATEALEPGTVITFEDPARPGELITHRVAEANDDGTYTTRGDANLLPDSTPVAPDGVVGAGRLLVPLIGLPITWLSGSALLFVAWLVVSVLAGYVAARPPEGIEDEDDDVGVGPGGDDPGPGPSVASARAEPRPDERRARRSRRQVPRHAASMLRGANDVLRGATAVVSVGVGRVRRLLGLPVAAARTLTIAIASATTRGLLRIVDRAPRRAGGWWRANLPLMAAVLATALAARAVWHLLVGAALTLVVLLLDPRGPELRIGRWGRTAASAATALAEAAAEARERLPEMDALRPIAQPAMAMAMIVASIATIGVRSAAAFSATTQNTGNSFAAAASWCASAGPVTVAPDADTYVDLNDADANFGLDPEMWVRGDDGKDRRTFVDFTLPARPAGCSLVSATLRLYAEPGDDFDVSAYRADAAWGEFTLTWNTQPTHSGTPGTTTLSNGVDGYYSWDVSSIVTDWLTGTPEHGFVVRAAIEGGGKLESLIYPREDTIGDPELVVVWG